MKARGEMKKSSESYLSRLSEISGGDGGGEEIIEET